jgi:hypothetical protein
MSDALQADAAALCARHVAELRRVQTFAADHAAEMPESLRDALDVWLSATVAVGLEALRLKHGITRASPTDRRQSELGTIQASVRNGSRARTGEADG